MHSDAAAPGRQTVIRTIDLLVSMQGKGPDRAAKTPLKRLQLRCPPLPQTLMETMALIEQPDQLEVGSVAAMVQRDPIVVARLLQIVNSAYYGLRHSVSSVERAVVMLGPVAVTGIVTGMNMVKLRSALEGPAADCFVRLVQHSLATAFLTRHLFEGAPRTPPVSRQPSSRVGVGFTAGLLHDFGKVALVYNYPSEACAFYEKQALQTQVRSADDRLLEQLLFGCDHTEAGEYVARKLNFPDLLVEVIRYDSTSGPPQGASETDGLLRAACAADLAASALGYGFPRPISWKTCTADPTWPVLLASDRPDLDDLTPLFGELQAQREHLDGYIENMMAAPTSSSSQGPRPSPKTFPYRRPAA